jgi:hypothetical protein
MIIVSFVFGNYDPITTAVPQAQTAMTIGTTATNWLETGMTWLVNLAIGSVCAGFGLAAFHEAHKAYKLWKRNAQAGRWQAGPNANYSRQTQSPKLSKQDMLLLALSGRLPQNERPMTSYQLPTQDDDDLRIEM